MKILALQGSPRGRAGVTDYVLQRFLAGAAAAGAEVETIYLAQKTHDVNYAPNDRKVSSEVCCSSR